MHRPLASSQSKRKQNKHRRKGITCRFFISSFVQTLQHLLTLYIASGYLSNPSIAMASRTIISKLKLVLRPIYTKPFEPRYLLLTNATLGTVFMSAADLIQQQVERTWFSDAAAGEKRPFDTNRTRKYCNWKKGGFPF